MAISTPIAPRVESAISPRRRRTTSPSSVRSAKAPQAESSTPAPTSTTVHTTVSRRIPWTASAVASSATPDKRIRPERKERVTSAPPLEVTGIEGQGDRADDQIERHGLGAHEPPDEIGKMQGERQIAEQTAQDVGRLEILQMADEPEAQQHRGRDQGRDDLVFRQGREELANGQAGHAEQHEPDVAREDRRRLGVAEQ